MTLLAVPAAPGAVAASPDGDAAAGTQQFLRFALGPDCYAVRIDEVLEILEVGKLTPLPLMPAFVRGVMNLRGAVVPVIDLGERLGLGTTEMGRRTCIVIVELQPSDDAFRVGVLVDAVHEVFDTGGGDGEPVPRLGTRIDPACIRSIVRVREQATYELNLATILDPQTLADRIGAAAGVH